MNLALRKFINKGIISINPVNDYIAAISCGIVNDKVLVDLDYIEDSSAQVDANLVISRSSGFSEIQISGEVRFPLWVWVQVWVHVQARHLWFELKSS